MISEKEIRDTYDIGKADMIRMADSVSEFIAIEQYDRAVAAIAQVNSNLVGLIIFKNILDGEGRED